MTSTREALAEQRGPAAAGYRADPWLCAATTALVGLGLVLVYSASSVRAEQHFGDAEYFLRSQASRVGVGVLGLLVVMRANAQAVMRRSGWVLLGAMALCGLVLVPGMGRSVGGAQRWLALGPVVFQPSELAKLAVVLVLAAYYGRASEVGKQTRRPNVWMPVAFVQPLVLLILLEPDLGTAVIIELIIGAMLVTAGLRWRTMALCGLAAAPVVYHLVVTEPYRLRRVVSFLDPWRYRNDGGYQLTQAWISLGSGGLRGVGLGESKRKLFFLPEAHTDFIFAILGEELGFVGVVFLLLAFAIVLWRGIAIAACAMSASESYLAVGLTALIGVPAVLNTCVATGLIPTKGLALPFVSYGGSNVVVCLLAVGLLLSVDRRAQQMRGDS